MDLRADPKHLDSFYLIEQTEDDLQLFSDRKI